MRNRIPSVGDKHVGNYENGLIYRSPDFKTAELIRQSVTKLCRAAIPRTEIPGFFELLTKGFSNASFSTNWTTFYDDLEFDDCKQVLHCPIYDLDDYNFGGMTLLFLFCPLKGKIAVFVAGPEQMMKSI
eukprot:CAMPEP_0167741448 /NCGR_PEP_ID=MMETSP0110_2-20121227/863_1 /TAXON_ID=629695 /ORGANISM="Gymnochlora sp., Strain CCMP2014" /LENGTH=128 /DNA_ID=CAMNT_0007625503 /DNA_START=903 /DNA_END=1286 /DNA_ORIENTATION=+